MEDKYSEKFINLVNDSFIKSNNLLSSEKEIGNPYYVGFGNPNARVLILGKEKGFNKDNIEQLNLESIENINEWKSYIDNNTSFNYNKFYPESQ